MYMYLVIPFAYVMLDEVNTLDLHVHVSVCLEFFSSVGFAGDMWWRHEFCYVLGISTGDLSLLQQHS